MKLNNLSNILIASALICAFVFTGCAKNPDNTQLANPASVYCEKQGGSLEIITAEDGSQSGVCTLKDGTKCDEWEYFRGECPGERHVCTDKEKAAEVCTMEYAPVCGNDGVTYGNKCSACGSKRIESWAPGECSVDCSAGCRQLSPPSPEFCKDGTIVDQGKDECGCARPPKCEPKACTEEAKLCSDGSSVGRIPPDCDFAPCPNLDTKYFCSVNDREKPCTKEYIPVCGWFNESIQCFKYPCASGYGNKCMACADPKVAYWTEGDCPK